MTPSIIILSTTALQSGNYEQGREKRCNELKGLLSRESSGLQCYAALIKHSAIAAGKYQDVNKYSGPVLTGIINRVSKKKVHSAHTVQGETKILI